MFGRKIETNTAESFDTMRDVEKYARGMEKMRAMYKDFLRYLQTLNPGNRMLEIGGGTGLLTGRVAGMYPQAEITVLELSPLMAENGREYLKGRGCGERVKWIIGNAEDGKLLTGLGKFDLIYCSLVLHEFKDPQNIISLFYDALNPNGRLAFLDLRRAWWLYCLPFNAGFFRSIRAALLPKEIREIFSSLGIENYRVRSAFPFLLIASAQKSTS